jgi:hypothetical protein
LTIRARTRGANHFEAIRSIRAGIDGKAALTSLLTDDLCTACSACLTHRLDSFFDRARGARVYRRLLRGKTGASKSLILPAFSSVGKFARGGARSRRAMWRAWPAFVETQHGVSARGPNCCIMRKRWFFCRAVVIGMQCSRSCGHSHDYATPRARSKKLSRRCVRHAEQTCAKIVGQEACKSGLAVDSTRIERIASK